MQSSVFFFGPGNWRLGHYPHFTTPNSMRFILVYNGQRAGAKKETETNNSASKFSFHAELSLLASDGGVFLKSGKKEYLYLARD